MTTWRKHLPEWKTHVDAVRQILLLEWDPICNRTGLIPQDEYDGYIPVIYRMLRERVSVESLARHLDQIADEGIGVTPERKRSLQVAEALLKILD
jgi:hypothetical protein